MVCKLPEVYTWNVACDGVEDLPCHLLVVEEMKHV